MLKSLRSKPHLFTETGTLNYKDYPKLSLFITIALAWIIGVGIGTLLLLGGV